MTLLEILALAPLVFWLLLAADRSRAWPRERTLPQEARLREEDASRVVAVVPARDEAEVLPDALPSLLSQGAGGFRVVLVDDGSSDGTAAVARRLAASGGWEARLSVVEAPPTPAGWTGKVAALAVGVEEARRLAGGEGPEWLLLTDADIRHRPGSVAALLARAAEGYDLVSVMARLGAESFWERLLLPPFVFFFQLLYPFRRVADPASRVAAAAGGCILVRRAVLEAAGGMEAIRGAVIDDVSLARQVKAAGGRLWLGIDPGIASVRPYREALGGLAGIWRMVARSAFIQLRCRWDLLLVTLLGLALFVVAPPFLLAAAGLALAGAAPAAVPSLVRAVAWAGGAWALGAVALLPVVRHQRVPLPFAAGLPFAGALYGLMTASSALRHRQGRGAAWKGRTYGGG